MLQLESIATSSKRFASLSRFPIHAFLGEKELLVGSSVEHVGLRVGGGRYGSYLA